MGSAFTILSSLNDLAGVWMSRFTLEAENGELRTDHLTQVAVNAGTLLQDVGIVVSLAVEVGGHFQDVLRAVFHTEAAAFAALHDDVEFAVRDLYLLYVKWYAPVAHNVSCASVSGLFGLINRLCREVIVLLVF